MMVPPDSARLTFRPFREEDLPLLMAIHRDPEVIKYVGWSKPPSEIENRNWLDRTLKSYRETGLGQMAVFLKESGEFIGRCGLRIVEIEADPPGDLPKWFWYKDSAPEGMPIVRRTEIGYTYSSRYWDKGYATEAVNGCCNHAFAAGIDNSIVAATFPENKPSARVLEKAGFRITGLAHGLGMKLVTHCLTLQAAD